MNYVEMSPFNTVIRLYDKPGGYEARVPYIACVMVQWLSRTEVHLCAAVGKVAPGDYIKAMALLKKEGVTTVTYERRGKMKIRTL